MGRLFSPNPKVTGDAGSALELVPKQQLDAAIAALASTYRAKQPTPVALTDGATVTINPSLGERFRLAAAGSRTLLAPGAGFDGQVITLEHKADTTARTLTLTTGASNSFKYGTDITILSATAISTTDVIQFTYNSAAARWWVTGYSKGF